MIRFKPLNDPVLHSVVITLDRKTGGSALQQAIIGSKATITVQAEVKNYMADPDDLIKKGHPAEALQYAALGVSAEYHSLVETRQGVYRPESSRRSTPNRVPTARTPALPA